MLAKGRNREMPQRPRYPSLSALIFIALRTAALALNLAFLACLGLLSKKHHSTYPAAYVAVCFLCSSNLCRNRTNSPPQAAWAICSDVPDIVVLLNKSRSIARLSAGGQLTLDIIGLLLLVPAAFLNWYSSSMIPAEEYDPHQSPAEAAASDFETGVVWVGCACLALRFILCIAVCVDCCTVRRRSRRHH
ncbi:hypothetical protein BJX61DRAFT_494438 [Aspergillus egyptiacus]|nr:hypothetical protein BJX61DRAFT_494438 [Aspergillus egyptiacus]